MPLKSSVAVVAGLTCLLGGARLGRAADASDVSYTGGRLSVRCAQTPLVEVLERIQAATGMELFLEEAVGHTRLSVEIEAQPLNLALESLLEGSGIAYAMTLDPDGAGVSRMFVGSEAQAKPLGPAKATVAHDRPANVPRLPVRAPERPPAPSVAPPAPNPASPTASADDEEDDDENDADMADDAELPAGVAEEGGPVITAPGTVPPNGKAPPAPLQPLSVEPEKPPEQ